MDHKQLSNNTNPGFGGLPFNGTVRSKDGASEGWHHLSPYVFIGSSKSSGNQQHTFQYSFRQSSRQSFSQSFPVMPDEPVMGHMSKRIRQSRAKQSNISRARPHIMRFLACLTTLGLFLTLIGFTTAFVSILLGPLVTDAQLQFQAQSDWKNREILLYYQLNNLQSTQLTKAPFESHQECLARGLRTADARLWGFAYEQSVRSEVIAWVEDNCGRLLFAPELIPDTLQPNSKSWAPANCKICKIMAESLDFAKQQSDLMKQKTLHFIRSSPVYALFNSTLQGILSLQWRPTDRQIKRKFASPPQVQDILTQFEENRAQLSKIRALNSLQNSLHDLKEQALIPVGFDLECQYPSPCRLVCLDISEELSHKVMVSEETIEQSARQFLNLHEFNTFFDRIRPYVFKVQSIYTALQAALLWIFIIAETYFGDVERNTEDFFNFVSSWKGYYLETYFLVLLQACAMRSLSMISKWEPKFSSETLVSLNLVFLIVGVTAVISFFFPNSTGQHIFAVFRSGNRIWKIMNGYDLHAGSENLDKEKDENREDLVNEGANSEVSGDTFNSAHKTTFSPTPRVYHRFSRTKTLREDIDAEIRALRARRDTAVSDDSDSSTDDDEDIDEDGDDRDNENANTNTTATVEPFVLLEFNSPSSSSSSSSSDEWSVVDI